jgi:hypothetical protein
MTIQKQKTVVIPGPPLKLANPKLSPSKNIYNESVIPIIEKIIANSLNLSELMWPLSKKFVTNSSTISVGAESAQPASIKTARKPQSNVSFVLEIECIRVSIIGAVTIVVTQTFRR